MCVLSFFYGGCGGFNVRSIKASLLNGLKLYVVVSIVEMEVCFMNDK